MRRIIVSIDDELVAEARQVAVRSGLTLSALVGKALEEHVERQRARNHRSFGGVGRSGEHIDLSDGRDEEILRREIHPLYGWAPDRHEPDR